MNIIKKLQELQNNSYAPYSKFSVSAIIITKDEKEFLGVNIENASFGATICAERSALSTLISNGENVNNIKEIHIMGSDKDTILSPCGICRQVLFELVNPDVNLFQYNFNGSIRKSAISELLPNAFNLKGGR